MERRSVRAKLAAVVIAGLVAFALAAAPPHGGNREQDEELQMGQEVFDELKQKGEIVEASPLYEQLRPIADAIARVAQPRYAHPFKFYLVHEKQPNAFATPGGNVYVVDSLLHLVKLLYLLSVRP